MMKKNFKIYYSSCFLSNNQFLVNWWNRNCKNNCVN